MPKVQTRSYCRIALLPVLLSFGCAIGFTPPRSLDPAKHPLNVEDQRNVLRVCKRLQHVRCAISIPINTLLIQGKWNPGHLDQKVEAETVGNMWCSLNRVQGSEAHVIFRYPDEKTMVGSSCQETLARAEAQVETNGRFWPKPSKHSVMDFAPFLAYIVLVWAWI